MKKSLILIAAIGVANSSLAQQSPLKISGYLETYYGFDFNKPSNNNRPGFVYSHNRHNEVNLNLGFIKATYDDGSVRANLALMTGTYSNANLSAEPGVLKNIFETNAGIKLSQKDNLWLDAGVFSSHIGFESAVSKDCWVLTRNIASENTPYYESGARVTYGTPDGKLTAAVLYLNGWQRINRQDSNSQPAGGIQFTWKPAAVLTLNYSNYLGSEGADSIRTRRFYNNFYGIFQLNEKLGLIAGFDYGIQQKEKGSNDYNHIISAVGILRYQVAAKLAMATRIEYYQDGDGMIISTGTPHGFKTTGYSLNIDYSPVTNALVRLEGKVYDSKDKIFQSGDAVVNHNALVTASIAISF
ncbi:putative OmpL-like beta-barrel porin-2 [Arcticibacter tournemirensis]|uniref:Porin n=1 Tax=Arcticibacter tournemirensis TaxID=699437 RepID=A0A5M9HET3_9SPHI|nr:porin [Arcticibacter tournemirensis]KAA8485300.1 porin [Arcticibacter tournemirensis]TQM50416.1 putative OmpL-like beta-barrel porin-2 [Arcticibacter tournemirensis]